jgi:hypothetical protein
MAPVGGRKDHIHFHLTSRNAAVASSLQSCHFTAFSCMFSPRMLSTVFVVSSFWPVPSVWKQFGGVSESFVEYLQVHKPQVTFTPPGGRRGTIGFRRRGQSDAARLDGPPLTRRILFTTDAIVMACTNPS